MSFKMHYPLPLDRRVHSGLQATPHLVRRPVMATTAPLSWCVGEQRGQPRYLISRLPSETQNLPHVRAFAGRDGCDGLEVALDLGAVRLKERRQRQMLAQMSGILVGGKARALGRNLEEDATGLTEVDGVEVEAVNDWRDV